ncbi:esterase-like activity of phytase family protein [Treponema sp.]|uniref:esterase-like activity of phytase family protein n=1 Tax=Treponema sp. TaxID=166 RepID=UPI00298D6DC6|nr:esterase-like activity of phytase family protein [Treponema sp.]
MKKIVTALIICSVCLSVNAKENKSAVSEKGAKIPFSILKTTDDGIEVRKGGFGSDACAYPGDNSKFYLITDRGPNIDYIGSNGKGKLFPVPEFNPEIGLFQIQKDGSVKLLKTIGLKSPDGKKITGLPNPQGKGATGEIAYDLNDNLLGLDEYGLDSEGLVAMKDGSFWISDEYGPHIVHFSAKGKELERISPYGMTTNGRKIPAVLENRRANRGMEGLAKTPDEKYLVGIMQSTLYNPSKKEIVNNRLIRIVKFELATGKTWQYLYQQNKETDSCCGITALSNDEFIVIERDGKFAGEEEAHKYLFKINLKDATDVNGDMTAKNGMLIDRKTLEQCTQAEVLDAGITFVKKELITDLVTEIGYGHDKLEGLWLLDDNTICVANDNDFALIEKDNKLCQKILPGTDLPEDDVVYAIKTTGIK